MSKIDRLNQLAKNFPDANNEVGKRQRAALMVSTRGMKPKGKQEAQQLAAGLTQGQAQINQQNQKSNIQGQLGLAEQRVQAESEQGSNQLARQKMAQAADQQVATIDANKSQQSAEIRAQQEITGREIDQAQKLQTIGLLQDNRLQMLDLGQREELARVGEDVKNKLFDNQLRFRQDERGRAFSNERQMADFAASSAKTQQEFESRMQDMQQANAMSLMMIESAHNKLAQYLEQGYNDRKQTLDQTSKRKIAAAIKELNDEKARMQKKGAMISNVLSGAAAGGSVGGVVGAGIGAGVGLGASIL